MSLTFGPPKDLSGVVTVMPIFESQHPGSGGGLLTEVRQRVEGVCV